MIFNFQNQLDLDRYIGIKYVNMLTSYRIIIGNPT